jgi:hypothetical protein
VVGRFVKNHFSKAEKKKHKSPHTNLFIKKHSSSLYIFEKKQTPPTHINFFDLPTTKRKKNSKIC